MTDWRIVMNFPTGNPSIEEIEARYRSLAKVVHPDMGGSDAAMSELSEARKQGIACVGDTQIVLQAHQHWNQQECANNQANWRDYLSGTLGGMAGQGAATQKNPSMWSKFWNS